MDAFTETCPLEGSQENDGNTVMKTNLLTMLRSLTRTVSVSSIICRAGGWGESCIGTAVLPVGILTHKRAAPWQTA